MTSGTFILKNWAETFFIALVLIGFFIALLINSAALSYIVVVLAGVIAGRFFFKRRIAQPIFPFILIMIGFLLGFMIGAIRANKFAIVVLFIIGTVGSYYLHKKGYFEYFKTAGFIR
ncbi:MAG: hypothetical protein KAT77_02700 [Nanoarchaeota archaeon]|nr:hypothetical protein [Nanoarchaeota archaeon]